MAYTTPCRQVEPGGLAGRAASPPACIYLHAGWSSLLGSGGQPSRPSQTPLPASTTPARCAGPQGSQMLWPWTDSHPHPKPGDPSLFSGPHWGSCILRSRAGGPRSWKTSSRWASAGWGPGPSGSGEAALGTGEGRLVLTVPGHPPVFLAPKEACSAPGPSLRCRPPRAVSAATTAAQVTVCQARVLRPGRQASGSVLPAGVGAEAPAPAALPTLPRALVVAQGAGVP